MCRQSLAHVVPPMLSLAVPSGTERHFGDSLCVYLTAQTVAAQRHVA